MSGFLNILKPPGMTSHDVVDFVRRRLKGIKVGHLGTLDPPASGVLPLAIGTATRLIQHLPPARKVYRAEVTFGRESDTLDAAGTILRTAPVGDLSGIEPALERFQGTIMQVPPRVSALKNQGRRGYDRARKGEDFQFDPRPATYHRVDLVRLESPRVWLDVDCGPGTYVRALARDLGEALGCPALLSFLIRLRSGPFLIETSHTLEDLLRCSNPMDLVQAPDRLFPELTTSGARP